MAIHRKNQNHNTALMIDEILQLKQIIKDLPGCVYWKDKTGKYLGCNNYFLKMVGLASVDEVVDKTDYDLSWHEQADSYRKHDKEVMLLGSTSFEEVATLATGEKLTYTVVKSPLHDANGQVIGIIGSSIDISEQKRLAEELKIAKEQAEALHLAKSEFIANMSHDVKTPLSGIIGMAEVLTYQLKQAEDIDFAQTILTAGRELLNFFDNCLEMAKGENVDLVLTKEHISLKNILDAIVDLFQPAVQTKNLDFFMHYDRDIPEDLLGNSAGIYRIILNLLGNAVKFTKEGSVGIRTKLSEKSTSKRAIVKITIEDTGIGIPEDKQKIIFERFTRLTPSYQGIYEGSGIGLSVVQKFVDAMNGEIYVKSNLNEGSKFTVVLPLERSLLTLEEYNEDDSKSEQNYSTSPDTQIIPQKKSQLKKLEKTLFHVLLVEDNLTAQKIANTLLSALNCKIDIAQNGSEALELFESGKYDLIFIDIGLPDISGKMVVTHLREMEKSEDHAIIIALTANVLDDLQTFHGIDNVITKPLSYEHAKKILAHYLNLGN